MLAAYWWDSISDKSANREIAFQELESCVEINNERAALVYFKWFIFMIIFVLLHPSKVNEKNLCFVDSINNNSDPVLIK